MKRIVGSTFDLSTKALFLLDKYQLNIWVENSVFAIKHIENRKSFTEVLPPPPPGGGGGGGGNAVKMLKNTVV